MSGEVSRSESEAGAGGGAPGARPRAFRSNGPPKKTTATKLWDLLQPLARLWGLVSSVVMSGAGAELVVLGYEVAPGLLVAAGMVFVLETMWVAALFVDLLCRRGEYTPALRCWDFARWSCGRARAPFYACVATALLFANITLLTTLAGGMVLVLAALRAAVPFSPHATRGPHSPRAGSSLLSQHDSPLPDVFYSAHHAAKEDHRCEEMKVLESKLPAAPARPATPPPAAAPASLLEL